MVNTVKSLEQVGRNWIAGWNSRDSEAFSRLYAPDGEYVDPSFGIRRKGRDFYACTTSSGGKRYPISS
jgi:uncharacterized protein (TIGR02246 family)